MLLKRINLGLDLKIKESLNYYKFKGSLGSSIIRKNKNIKIILHLNSVYLVSKNKQYFNSYCKILLHTLTGVFCGFIFFLRIIGVGYLAQILGNYLEFHLGFSHKLNMLIPKSIYIEIVKKRFLIFLGYNLEHLHKFSCNIRLHKVPDNYKGKGIFINNEVVSKKIGKKI